MSGSRSPRTPQARGRKKERERKSAKTPKPGHDKAASAKASGKKSMFVVVFPLVWLI